MIQYDCGNDNAGLNEICDTLDIMCHFVAADDYKANGLVENANRTVRFFSKGLWACDKRCRTKCILADSTFCNNISLESRSVSAFELRYGPYASLTPTINAAIPLVTAALQNVRLIGKRRTNSMLRSQLRHVSKINVSDTVEIWREGSGWLFPARVRKCTPYYYELMNNRRLKKSSITRTPLLQREYIKGDESDIIREEYCIASQFSQDEGSDSDQSTGSLPIDESDSSSTNPRLSIHINKAVSQSINDASAPSSTGKLANHISEAKV